LLSEGIVSQADYDKAMKKEEKKALKEAKKAK